jgi:hypothetical protein
MNASQQPPERSGASPTSWWSVLSRGQAIILGVAAVLTALVAIVTNWNELESLLFPAERAAEARIEAPEAEAMTRQVYESGLTQRAASTAAVTGSAAPRLGFRTSFAVYAVPAAAQPVAGRLVALSLEEEAKHNEEEVKRASEKSKEEAKLDEENFARERSKAMAEQKTAEAHEQEEQKKQQEAQKRVEETQQQNAAQAKAAQAKAEEAKRAAEKAHETVQTKKQEVARPPVQERIERGTPPDQIEEVLRKAGDSEPCRKTCSLKPFVEMALKEKSGNTTAAAKLVHTVAASNTGAFLYFHVTLKGLEHKVVFLNYVLVQNNGQELPVPYRGRVTIKTVAPLREPESRWVESWLPVPSSSQTYHLDLTVSDSSQEYLDISKTNSFE